MAAALVGGAFLSASLQVLFDRIASREVIDFFSRRKLNASLLKKLEVALLSVNNVLDDAENKQFLNNNVKKWLNELRDAVYDAEDLLEEIATDAQISKATVRSFFASFSPFNKGMESKLEEILGRLEYLAKQKDFLCLSEGVRGKSSQKLPSTSLVDESDVYGRDGDREAIMKLLMSDDEDGNGLGVIAIVGMGGIGKTSLAQIVYNDNRLKGFFDLNIWVCVSDEFDVSRLTKSTVEAITSRTCEVEDLNLLQVKLAECLAGKKFLLVLDDVWNESYMHWEALRSPLTYGAKGSKIIVTTRSENVARVMQTVPIYHLGHLADAECWSIFAKHAFGSSNSGKDPDPNLYLIGKDLVKKCLGLPLAAKAIGGLLRFKRDISEWYDILNNDLWELSHLEDGILPALRLSYHYLPSHLKRCFAYCSIFPKGHEFDVRNLILLWRAEGFLQQPIRVKRLQDVGFEYFNSLLSRSFFQRSRSTEDHYVMHDLISDLAKEVSGDFCLRLEGTNFHAFPKNVRHFAYSRTGYEDSEKFKGFLEGRCLRTFLPLKPHLWVEIMPYEVFHNLLPMLRSLRVLNLSKYDNIEELPSSIGELRLLSYLNLAQTPIKKLPDSVCSLYNLETLLLTDCGCLTELPAHMDQLINLCDLDVNGATLLKEMPPRLGRLKNLQTLSSFIVGKCSGSCIRELGELQHLQGTLSISNLQHVIPLDALEAKLKDKEFLSELTLTWGGDTDDTSNERDVLNMLQPHTNLKKLSINNYGGTKFSDWLVDFSFSNIVSLRLSQSKYCLFLPPLGRLPSLKSLFIIGFDAVEQVGPEFYGNGFSDFEPFQCLEVLWFEGMQEWQEWIPLERESTKELFPKLQELHIRKCPKLRGTLPSALSSLEKLMVIDCQQLMVSILRTPALYELHIGRANKVLLRESPPSMHKFTIRGYETLESLPLFMQSNHLAELKISNCPSLLFFPQDTMPATLRRLDVLDCKRLEFPMQSCHDSLENLLISHSCNSLRSFKLQLFPKLSNLAVLGCRNLESLSVSEGPDEILTSLSSLKINLCPNFDSFPGGGLSAPNLTCIEVSHCSNLKSLPKKMASLLPSLKSLKLYNCPELESFPEDGLAPSLKSLFISFCDKLIASRREWGLQSLCSLKLVSIGGHCKDIESFPEELLLPSTLTHVIVHDFPNVKSLNSELLESVTSLQKLMIHRCPALGSISGEKLPTSLSLLLIEDCPLLK